MGRSSWSYFECICPGIAVFPGLCIRPGVAVLHRITAFVENMVQGLGGFFLNHICI